MLDPEINGKDYNKSDHSSPNLAMSGGFLEGVSNFLTKGSTTILLGVVFVVVLFAEITMMSGAETTKVEVDLYSVCVTAIATGSVALLFAYYLGKQVIAMPTGTIKMQEIATAIQEGATAFLKQEYKWLSMFVAVVAALITVHAAAAFALHGPDVMRKPSAVDLPWAASTRKMTSPPVDVPRQSEL